MVTAPGPHSGGSPLQGPPIATRVRHPGVPFRGLHWAENFVTDNGLGSCSTKMIVGVEMCGEILENCNADLEKKMQMSIILLISHAFVNFFTVHDTKLLKFKVQKFECHSVFSIEEYIV